MWFERDEDGDLLINYDDFPPLPDFQTISSCSNNLNPNNNITNSTPSSSLTYSQDQSGIPPEESCVGSGDDIWDPSTLFPCDGLDAIGFGKQQEEEQEKTTPSMFFFEWLKSNKESISAEDLRSIKLKRSTIECAAKRLGGGKQGMKQLLKLILEWVQNHQLQRKRIKQRDNSSLFQQSNPYSNTVDPYLLPPPMPQWISHQPYNAPQSTTWPTHSQHYAVAFPDQNLAPTPADQLVSLGSSPTKEARKKRMARQKRSES